MTQLPNSITDLARSAPAGGHTTRCILLQCPTYGTPDLVAGGASVVLNLGTGEGHTVKEVIAAVEQVTGRKVPHRVGSRPLGDPTVLVADPGRAGTALDGAPRVRRWRALSRPRGLGIWSISVVRLVDIDWLFRWRRPMQIGRDSGEF